MAYKQDAKDMPKFDNFDRHKRKKVIEEAKIRVQNAFKSTLNFVPDVPSPQGGNTTTGNMANKVFDNWHQSAINMNINPDLVFRFAVIIETLSLNKKINLEKFEVNINCIITE